MFGHYRLNYNKAKKPEHQQYFRLEDPPNDRKRKDKIFDLSDEVIPGLNTIEIMHKTRAARCNASYVCGIFICKNFAPQEMIDSLIKYQPVITYNQTY